jgi:hypothetical protein
MEFAFPPKKSFLPFPRNSSSTVVPDITRCTSYCGVLLVDLRTTFCFWPVHVIGVSDGWAYGNYRQLRYLGHRELLEAKGLRMGRRNKGNITDSQVEASFLHHEDLAVALEAGRILFETHHLDSEQFCEPVTLVSEKKAKEALLSFIGLKDGDDAAAVRYINEFGEFDHLELNEDKFVGTNVPGSIQQFCKQQILKREDPFAVSLSHFWAVRDDIEGLSNLAAALDQKDSSRARAECLRRRPNSRFNSEPNWLSVGKAILSADLSASLNPGQRNPRLILSENEGSFVALTMGTTVRSALYLSLLDLIVSKTEYKTCLNCKKPFIVTVKRKQYCTDVCQNTAKARRFRVRHKGDTSGRRTLGKLARPRIEK